MPSGNYQVQVDGDIVGGYNEREDAINAARAWKKREPDATVKVWARGKPMTDSRGNRTGAFHKETVEYRRETGVRPIHRGWAKRYE